MAVATSIVAEVALAKLEVAMVTLTVICDDGREAVEVVVIEWW